MLSLRPLHWCWTASAVAHVGVLAFGASMLTLQASPKPGGLNGATAMALRADQTAANSAPVPPATPELVVDWRPATVVPAVPAVVPAAIPAAAPAALLHRSRPAVHLAALSVVPFARPSSPTAAAGAAGAFAAAKPAPASAVEPATVQAPATAHGQAKAPAPEPASAPASPAAGTQAVTEPASALPPATAALAATQASAGDAGRRAIQSVARPNDPRRDASGEGADQAVAYALTPLPPYPARARALGQEGLAVVRVLVAASGLPADIHLLRSSSYADLDAAALTALQAWRFRPALRQGGAVPATLDVPVRFVLAHDHAEIQAQP